MLYHLELKTFPKVTRFYSVTRNTVWQISEQEHLLIFINEGECQICFDGNMYLLQAGDVFFIPKDCPYTRSSVNGTLCTMTYLHFLVDGEFLKYDDLKEIKPLLLPTATENDAGVKNYIFLENKHEKPKALKEMIAKLSKYGGVNKSFLMSISLCEILTLLSNERIEKIVTKTDEATQMIPKKLRRCMDYISRRYTENITLDELSEHCRVSKQHLIRYFKSSLNTTPMQYVTGFKIARAKEMLFYSGLSINEISLELGFDNQHYFAKVFKRITKETPSEYRNRTVNFKNPSVK